MMHLQKVPKKSGSASGSESLSIERKEVSIPIATPIPTPISLIASPAHIGGRMKFLCKESRQLSAVRLEAMQFVEIQ